MARQVAIAVGVAKVDGLPFLAAVKPGIDAFAAWASGQDFVVTVHEDSAGPVDGGAVFASIRDAVKADDIERLFLFFSGHGMERSVGDDLWLLSDAVEDSVAAVNVGKTLSLAKRSGVGHVAVFADACRTPASGAFDHLLGRPLFPQRRTPNARTDLDVFFGTLSGDPAYEPGFNGEPLFGLFTQCLLNALRGREPEAVTEVAGGRTTHAVLARPLGEFLYDEVREVSSRDVHVTQTPDYTAVSGWEPNVISWVAVPSRAPAPPAPPGPPDAAGADAVTERRWAAPAEARPARRRLGDDDRRALRSDLAERLGSEGGRGHYETRIGASVVGATLLGAEAYGGSRNPFEEVGRLHVRGEYDTPSPLLLAVDGAAGLGWFATALLPGYETTVTAGPDGAEHVAFVEIEGAQERDRRALAEAAAAARLGRRDFADDGEGARLLEAGNPTMAVLAAYAFDRLGRDEDLKRIVDYCLNRHGLLPYDVALLAERFDERVMPDFPLMARGWALADSLRWKDDLVTYLRTRLARAPWTTFRELDDRARGALMEVG